MPRKLPWLEDGASNTTTKKCSAMRPPPAPTRPKRSSSPSDLVGSDLEEAGDGLEDDDEELDLELGTRRAKAKGRSYREPSSSPPPPLAGPPPVEHMREGYEADDVFMMVEDEFYTTAQLYTRHIHQAEYMRLKKLHRSRGQETLAAMGHGTDGKTDPSRALRLKMEAQEKAKKRAQGMLLDSDDDENEDEYMFDPQPASLMTGSQVSQQSPSKPSPRKQVQRLPVMAEEDVGQDDETDSDDLDGPTTAIPPRSRTIASSSKTRPAHTRPQVMDKSAIFRQFSKSSSDQRRSSPSPPRPPPSSPPPRHRSTVKEDLKSASPPIKKEPGTYRRFKPSAAKKPSTLTSIRSSSPEVEPVAAIKTESNPTRAGGYFAKRRAAKDSAEVEDKRKIKEEDSIPTFLF